MAARNRRPDRAGLDHRGCLHPRGTLLLPGGLARASAGWLAGNPTGGVLACARKSLDCAGDQQATRPPERCYADRSRRDLRRTTLWPAPRASGGLHPGRRTRLCRVTRGIALGLAHELIPALAGT